MQRAWAEIGRLIAVKAVHRKGFVIGQVPLDFITSYAHVEINELAAATSPAERLEELADVLGIVIHYAHVNGFTMDQLGAELLRKLAIRFSERQSPNRTDHGTT